MKTESFLQSNVWNLLLGDQLFLAAHIGTKHFGDGHGTVFVQVLLQKRNDETRQRDAGTVERVDELRLAVRILEAAVEAACLVVGEAGAGGNLEPLLLARSPKLEVVALGGGKAHIARAELKNAVMKTEPLENVFRLGDENLKLIERGVGMDEVDHLHLVELVDAEHAARHLAGAARLAAEARRVGGELDGRLGRDLRELAGAGH